MMIEFIKELAETAGQKLLEFSGEFEVDDINFKNDRDLVTAYDQQTEGFLVSGILKKFPKHNIFGEETGKTDKNSEYCWVIDPIDGTTSFVHGQPFYSISIALQKQGETVLGLVYAPRLQEMFWAEKWQGAYRNGKRIKVSSRDTLIQSVLSTGFACLRAELPENNLERFCRITPKLRGVRRFGSAAVDLSYVACGCLEGFWEMNLKPYDVAAGIIILQEAGGVVSDFHGGVEYPEKGIVATNGLIADELLELM